MANLPEKNVVLVDKITNVPTDSNLFINANGEFKQASVNDVVNSSTVVSTAVETAINTAVQDSIDSNFKQTSGSPILLTDSADGSLIDFKAYGKSTQQIKMIQGYYDSLAGTYATNTNAVCNEKPIPCKTGDNIEITVDTTSTIIVIFYNGSSFVSSSKFENTTKATFTIPSNTNYYNFDIIKNSSVTPSTVGAITITVNGSVSYPNPDYPQAIKSVADGGYFDGELLQGDYSLSTGAYQSKNGYVSAKNPIPCNSGDTVKIITAKPMYTWVYFYNEETFVSYIYSSTKLQEYEFTIPSGVTHIKFTIGEKTSDSTTTIDNVGKVCVTINGKYALIVKSVGKNLLNLNDNSQNASGFTYNSFTNELVEGVAKVSGDTFICSYSAYFEKGKTYIFSFDNTSNLQQAYIYSDKLWGNQLSSLQVTSYPYYTHNVDSGVCVIGWYGRAVSGTTYRVSKPMLRLAEVTDDTYEPYKEEVKYIPLNEPLRSSLDGSVTDEVSLTEVTRRFTEVVFDGSDDEGWVLNSGYTSVFYTHLILFKGRKAICDNYVVTTNATVNEINNSDYLISIGNYISVKDKRFTTVDEFKAWLQANPITVQYELAEPIVEAIEPVDIVTYDNVTYLTASDNAEMEVEYPTTKVAGIASIGYSKGIKAEYETEQLKKQLLEIQATIVNTL